MNLHTGILLISGLLFGPLVKGNDGFKYLNIDAGIVLGIIEDFDYASDEITLADELVI